MRSRAKLGRAIRRSSQLNFSLTTIDLRQRQCFECVLRFIVHRVSKHYQVLFVFYWQAIIENCFEIEYLSDSNSITIFSTDYGETVSDYGFDLCYLDKDLNSY